VADGVVVATSAAQPRPRAPDRTHAGPAEGRIPPRLHLCRACNAYTAPEESMCPHCGADIQTAATVYEDERRARAAAVARIEQQLAALRERAEQPA
jgi:uncharacterized OB-fold protein